MITIGCAACIASSVLSNCEETTKAMHAQKCNWQQNSEKLKKLRDRNPKTEPQD